MLNCLSQLEEKQTWSICNVCTYMQAFLNDECHFITESLYKVVNCFGLVGTA